MNGIDNQLESKIKIIQIALENHGYEIDEIEMKLGVIEDGKKNVPLRNSVMQELSRVLKIEGLKPEMIYYVFSKLSGLSETSVLQTCLRNQNQEAVT